MRVGSLCSGFGGLEAAIAAVIPAARTVWHMETDDAASLVLKAHHPDVPNHGSVVGADWSSFEPVEMLALGVPCQAVSSAGRQLVEADSRWLWPQALEAIRTLRPRGFFFENVRNLISIRGGEVWRDILGDMRAAGYAVRWLTVGACMIGAPHHRHRVFALGVRPPVSTGLVRDSGHPPARLDVAECDKVRPLLPTPVARDGSSRGEGSPEYWASRRDDPSRATKGIPLGAAVALLPSLGDRWDKYGPAVAHWGRVTGRPAPDPTEVGPRGGQRLTAVVSEWMMGLPAGYLTDHVGRVDALRIAGNGVCPMHGAHALRLLLASF